MSKSHTKQPVLLNLSELWRVAGAEQGKQPVSWLETVSAIVDVKVVARNGDLWTEEQGTAARYAKFLSPRLHSVILEWEHVGFMQRLEMPL